MSVSRSVWVAVIALAATAGCKPAPPGGDEAKDSGGSEMADGSGGVSSSCLMGAVSASSLGNSACTACAEMACASDISTLATACSELLSCVCAGGSYSNANIPACSVQTGPTAATSGGCMDAGSALALCEQEMCPTTCNDSMEPDAATEGDGGALVTLWHCVQTPAAEECTQELGTAESESTLMQVCSLEGGSFGMGACPTAGIVGCCNAPGTKHTSDCFYTASRAATEMGECIAPSTWTASPMP
jgi:hypothetical protein